MKYGNSVRLHRLQYVIVASLLLLVRLPAVFAQFDSGSDGSDLAFTPPGNTTIDLANAGSGPTTGTYDSDEWAVVFNYTSINIPPGVTVTFANHPSGAPVVWLAQGNVTIGGAIILTGAGGAVYPGFATPGPGGFQGGRANAAGSGTSYGLGPGGGSPGMSGGAGGYGTPGQNSSSNASGGGAYGNLAILPLIGGSGGAGGTSYSGAAGGGGILIASSGTITVNGSIVANGGAASGGSNGGGGGSGGAIRLLANSVAGPGSVQAIGGVGNSTGGAGRIRIEAESIGLFGTINPPPSYDMPGTIFPSSSAPSLRITQIDGMPMPVDPIAGILTTDLAIFDPNPVLISIEAMNIPPGTSVTVRLVPEWGSLIQATSTPLAGSLVLSTATASVTFPQQKRSEIQLRANWIP